MQADGALDSAVGVDEVEVAEVGESADAKAGDSFERDSKIERLGERAAGVGEELKIALGAAAAGDVAEDENDAGENAIAVVDGSAAVVDGDFGAVAAEEHGVIGEADDGSHAANLVDGALDGFAGAFLDDVEDFAEGMADGFVLLPSGELFGDAVHENDVTARVTGNHCVAYAAEHGRKPEIVLCVDDESVSPAASNYSRSTLDYNDAGHSVAAAFIWDAR
jgi:hypothetical protein